MSKIVVSLITVGLITGIGIVLLSGSRNATETSSQSGKNVEVRDGVQYITIDAKGGYFPRASSARADIPTKLIVKTNSTFDCSSALVIRSIGYQKMLSQSGEEIIDIGTPPVGTSLKGTCSMGMYYFAITFS